MIKLVHILRDVENWIKGLYFGSLRFLKIEFGPNQKSIKCLVTICLLHIAQNNYTTVAKDGNLPIHEFLVL